MTKTIKIYGCGGTGANIVQDVLDLPAKRKGFAIPEYVIVDTSLSNIRDRANRKIQTFMIPDADGGGGNRAYALEIAKPHIVPCLKEHTPGDLNIVIFSLSGASGSVIGPLIASQLMAEGKPVIAVTVGNFTNWRETVNTYNGFATLQSLAARRSVSLPVTFFWIDEKGTVTDADVGIRDTVRHLAQLGSGENHGLDFEDIKNWINYNRVTEATPQMIELVIQSGFDQSHFDHVARIRDEFRPISVASILPYGSNVPPRFDALFDVSGSSKDQAVTQITSFLLTTKRLPAIIDVLRVASEKAKQVSAQHCSTSVPQLAANADSDGFIV